MTSPIRMRAICATLTAAMTCAGLAAASGASASSSQPTMLQDDSLTLPSDRRDSTLDEWKSLGVDTVKMTLTWRNFAPDATSEQKPNVDLADPASYDAREWQRYDQAIRGAQQRGMNVFLMIAGGAPDWASDTSPDGLPGGVQNPDAAAYGQFVQAVGKRYSGTYTAPAGPYSDPNALPRVSLWSVWNEPNLASWLSPQYDGKTPKSPELYRNLVYAARDGLAASGHGGDTLLIGELLPFARGGTGNVKVRPIEFLRDLGCVDKKYRPLKGSAATKQGCAGFKPLPGNGLAYHPYTLAGGPGVNFPNKDDASIGQLGRVTSALDKLTKRKRFAQKRKLGLWSTEFGFQTDPPDPVQSPIKKVPGFMGEAEWIAYKNPRVASWSQYPFADDPIPDEGDNRFGGFQSGLLFEDGRRKRAVYHEFQFPIFARLASKSKVEVFGGVRAGAPGAQVVVESRSGKAKFKALKGGRVKLGKQGYFDRTFTVPSASKREFRFRFAKDKSRSARPLKR
ncbi:MAG: hypothetical protein QOJ07_1590 [Thermoleophilaceae bacterium]|nr:hypothetical protein [Thermoleophilaceae bacterium]